MGGEHFRAFQTPRPHSFVEGRLPDVILFVFVRAAVEEPLETLDVSGEGRHVRRRLAESFRLQIHRVVGECKSAAVSVIAMELYDLHEAVEFAEISRPMGRRPSVKGILIVDPELAAGEQAFQLYRVTVATTAGQERME